MPRGGKRKGAGKPKGSTHKFDLAKLCTEERKDRVIGILDAWLKSKDPNIQRAVVKELLPYMFRKQPTEIESTNDSRITLTAEQVRRLPQDKLDRLIAGEAPEVVLANERN